ncbi:MAG: flippase-like domain-containing protein [Bacteroidetes bacterium]|nr:flippase-like domain-containing protein [Bacteroidota bacterium]MBU1117109.1 flippase-like domain-containing protein [Bacteroidota bacterium]MBU1798640.1 flippase-like domain-containing protein [Bacteroidota bacterium]
MTSDNKKKHKFQKYFGFILPILLMILFLYLAFKDVDFQTVIKILSQLSISWFALFIFVFFLSHFLRAVRWKIMLNSTKPNTSVLNLFGATMIGYGLNSIIPRLGELYRGFFAGKWENISRSVVLGTIIVERVIDILALGISVLISVLIYEGDLYSEVTWLKSTVIFGFGAIIFVILILFFLVKFKEKFYSLIIKIVSKFSKKIAAKIAYVFEMVIDGFSTIKSVSNFIWVIFYSILIMLNYGLSAELGFYVLNLQNNFEVNYTMSWILMTISAFGIIIPTPGGTGTYHFIGISVLVSLFAFTEEAASAYVLLTHTVSIFVFITSMFLFMGYINNKREKMGLQKENFLSVIKGDKTE